MSNYSVKSSFRLLLHAHKHLIVTYAYMDAYAFTHETSWDCPRLFHVLPASIHCILCIFTNYHVLLDSIANDCTLQ